MTTTKTVRMVLIAVGLLMAVPAWPQDAAQVAKVPPRVRAEIQTKFMTEKLHLTPEEQTKIDAINVKYADQMQPVLEGSMGPLVRMREVKRVEAAKDGELKTTLTPDQYTAYQASKDELRERIKQRALAGDTATP
jgi:hypothetical protein